MVKCQCPMCGEFFETENEWLGQEAQCLYCEQVITIQAVVVLKPRRLTVESAVEEDDHERARYQEEEKQKSPASLVLGIIGLFAWLIPLIGFPVTITGLILGIRKRYALGIWLNAAGLMFSLINSVLGAIMGACGQLF